MNGRLTLFFASLILWPSVFWAIDATTLRVFPDWTHDPRFYNAYIIPATLSSWINLRTGVWHGQSEWVATQNGVASVVVSIAFAAALVRFDAWRERPLLRASVALCGLVLPFYQRVQSVSTYYPDALAAFFGAYCIAVVSGLAAPVGRSVRLAVLILASVLAVAFTGWLVATWHWSFALNLFASLALLFAVVTRVVHNERAA